MKPKRTARLVLVGLILLFGSPAYSAQGSSDTQVERLVALCKLWNAVRFLHPYLAYRSDVDWDKAAVETIPRVSAAKTPEEYAAAVEQMLQVLDDPATHVIRASGTKTETPKGSDEKRPVDPVARELPGGVLLVSITHYADLSDYVATLKKASELKEEISKAQGVVFDLRPAGSLSEDESGALSLLFDFGKLSEALSASDLATPAQRSRIHFGFVPQRGSTSGGYESAFYTALGPRIIPSKAAKDQIVVFLVNKYSELPMVAAALQEAGKGAIVAEGSTNDESIVATQRILLTDGVVAQVRRAELLHADGSGGLRPDVTVAASTEKGEQDPALQEAIKLAHTFKQNSPSRTPLPATASPYPDKPYTDMAYPPEPYRVLAAFRIWGVIDYFFPYMDLMGENWDDVLRQFIPRMEKAGNAREYNLAVADMVTHIHDGHGFVDSPILQEFFGVASTPVRVRMIEGMPVITGFYNEQAAKAGGAELGDIVLKVDGENAMDRLNRLAKYISSSTPQWQMYRAANAMLRGPEGSVATITVRDLNDQVKELKLPRQKAFRDNATERTGEVFQILPGDIGYVDLDRLTVPMVNDMFEKFKTTKAIVLDDRTYPNGTAWSIAPRLTQKNSVVAAMFQRRVAMFPDGSIGDIASQSVMHTFYQSIPHTDQWRYQGKTVMLIDERTISQAEHTGLFFEAANGTKFIGSPTAGANGDVTNFCVPGGIWINFTGQAVRHADGRQLQRIGLVPDVEVQPTLKGIRAGKDEVLEKALAYVRGSTD